MSKQITNQIVMVRPVSFYFDTETAANDFFQKNLGEKRDVVQAKALIEFDAMVDLQDDALHRRQDQRMVIDQQHFHRQTPRAPQACPDPMVAPGGASPHLAGSPPKEESQPSTS